MSHNTPEGSITAKIMAAPEIAMIAPSVFPILRIGALLCCLVHYIICAALSLVKVKAGR